MSNEVDGTETTIILRKDPVELPELVVPPGLPLERQWYLYDKIREFCPDQCKDLAKRIYGKDRHYCYYIILDYHYVYIIYLNTQ